MKKIVALFCIIMFSGCTAVTVRTPQGVAQIERVKIRENPKVIVALKMDHPIWMISGVISMTS